MAFCKVFSLQDDGEEGKEEFAIVFAAMGVNMETAHYFKQVLLCIPAAPSSHAAMIWISAMPAW